MVLFSNCKINLGLNILEKRQDGYHNIETVFFPLQLFDAIEIIEKKGDNKQTEIEFTHSGLEFTVDETSNLCFKVYDLLKKDFPNLASVKIHLHKTIPMGAGLGGGSANATFTLLLLNKKFQLNLTEPQLYNYALKLGSDCPFFILNKPCFAQSRGEILNQIKLNLAGYKIVVVNPNIHVNTAWAFTQILPKTAAKKITEIIQQPIQTWRDELINDFEKPVFEKYPLLQNIKQQLYNHGALYASMSGSGSTVYGIFDIRKQITDTIFPKEYFVKEVEIKN